MIAECRVQAADLRGRERINAEWPPRSAANAWLIGFNAMDDCCK
jgi:hypothetical protein